MVAKAIFKRAGIIGGLGPETSSKFCLNVNMKFRDITNAQPDFVMENLPVSAKAEKELIDGRNPKEYRKLLRNAVIRLNNSKVDFIVIPCNTVHFLIKELRRMSKIPILSIIEECFRECKGKNFKKVGLLATSATINEKLFENEFNGTGIELVLPSKTDQIKIDKIILKILNNQHDEDSINIVLELIKKLKNEGAEAIILGCTDLSLLISSQNFEIPVLDTSTILENSLVNNLIK